MGDTFYTDHWRDIEDDRIARYEQMFQWRDGQAVLLEGADLEAGQRVLDLGAGPGFFATALADRVGSTGAVDGADINARFVESANARAAFVNTKPTWPKNASSKSFTSSSAAPFSSSWTYGWQRMAPWP